MPRPRAHEPRSGWAQRPPLRELWRSRRLRFTREGWYYFFFTIGVGAAALNTGNNLLFLVLGLQLTAILVSGFLSDLALFRLEIEREPASDAVEGEPFLLHYRVRNHKGFSPSYALFIGEKAGPLAGIRAGLLQVGPRRDARAALQARVARRGRYELRTVVVSTRFPFGLFEKSQDFIVPGELWVLPGRTAIGAPGAPAAAREGERPEGRPGPGGEFLGLRELRPGDDRRQVHWRKSASAGRLLVIERERERRRRVLLALDNRGEPGDWLDEPVRRAASLARHFSAQGFEVGLSVSGHFLPPRAGPAAVRAVLRALAALEPAAPSGPSPETRGEGVQPVRRGQGGARGDRREGAP